MPVVVEIGGEKAEINDYKWTSEDKVLQGLLNSMIDPIGPSGADPYPDLTAADDAVKRLGGKVVEIPKQEPLPTGRNIVF